MDSKKEGEINRLIIKISGIVLLLVGIGVLVIEYIYWIEHWVSNATAFVVFTVTLTLYGIITFVLLKNRKKLFNLGEGDED